jgi:hypothetical protein
MSPTPAISSPMVGTAGGEGICFQQLGLELRTAHIAGSVTPVVQPPQRVVDGAQFGVHLGEQRRISFGWVFNGFGWMFNGVGWIASWRDRCIGHMRSVTRRPPDSTDPSTATGGGGPAPDKSRVT